MKTGIDSKRIQIIINPKNEPSVGLKNNLKVAASKALRATGLRGSVNASIIEHLSPMDLTHIIGFLNNERGRFVEWMKANGHAGQESIDSADKLVEKLKSY